MAGKSAGGQNATLLKSVHLNMTVGQKGRNMEHSSLLVILTQTDVWSALDGSPGRGCMMLKDPKPIRGICSQFRFFIFVF